MSKKGNRMVGLLLFESILMYLCGVFAIYLRFGDDAGSVFNEKQGWLKILLAQTVVQLAFYLFDLYDFQMIRHRSVLINRILQALGLSAIALAMIFYGLPQMMLGRGVFLVALLLMLTLMLAWRLT